MFKYEIYEFFNDLVCKINKKIILIVFLGKNYIFFNLHIYKILFIFSKIKHKFYYDIKN